jgi:hypothetical protein
MTAVLKNRPPRIADEGAIGSSSRMPSDARNIPAKGDGIGRSTEWRDSSESTIARLRVHRDSPPRCNDQLEYRFVNGTA